MGSNSRLIFTDVTISYNGSTIGEMSSGTKTINTAGTYCVNDIVVSYTRPDTRTIDVNNCYLVIPSYLGNMQIDSLVPIDEHVFLVMDDESLVPFVEEEITGATNIVQGDFTTSSTRDATGTFSINYTGTGYPIALMIYVKGGPYNNDSSTGNTTWYSSLNRYDVGFYSMVKARVPNTPTYDTSGANNYGTAMITYKYSTTSSTTYTRAGAVNNNVYTSSSTVAEASTKCVKFKGDGKTVSYYVGNLTSSTIGFPPSTEFSYIAIYSS